MAWKSIFKPENSVIAGVAVLGTVYGVYSLSVGSVSDAQATDANHPILDTSRKKAGLSSLVLVGGITLITKDMNVFILGCAAIVGMELMYRHAIMAHPQSGAMQDPDPSAAYAPAQNVIPFNQQGNSDTTQWAS